MGYRNQQTGYPPGILSTRARIKKNVYALIPPDGLVKNVVPGFENCELSILASPKLGAHFVDYLASMLPGGGNRRGFGGDGVETFVYVLSGGIRAGDGEESFDLDRSGYLYVPGHKKMFLENRRERSELFLYKRRYKPLEGYRPHTAFGHADQLPAAEYEGMKDVHVTDLLPVGDPAFDMNFHILSFARGASHGYIETHVQEHGALILSGEGMYNLDNEWMPVKQGDYIFMAAYALQAGYGIGPSEDFSYIYSKDCHRDEEI
jgi:(S)-ureidoglycine aminohydrolase